MPAAPPRRSSTRERVATVEAGKPRLAILRNRMARIHTRTTNRWLQRQEQGPPLCGTPLVV
jgi:hypothetical protein